MVKINSEGKASEIQCPAKVESFCSQSKNELKSSTGLLFACRRSDGSEAASGRSDERPISQTHRQGCFSFSDLILLNWGCKAFVRDSKSLRGCPAPGCGNFAKLSVTSRPIVIKCSCSEGLGLVFFFFLLISSFFLFRILFRLSANVASAV